jgi:hypothetical protein
MQATISELMPKYSPEEFCLEQNYIVIMVIKAQHNNNSNNNNNVFGQMVPNNLPPSG